MKTNFLKSLGIEEQETIDAIMAENGKDIEKAKGDLENYKNRVDELTGQLADRDKQLTDLKKSNKDNEELQQKIAELEESNKQSKENYENKIKAFERAIERDSKLREAKAKDPKVVAALMNDEEDDEVQIKRLKENEVTGLLFESEADPNKNKPAGFNPANPPAKPSENGYTSFADAVKNALNFK